MTLAGLVHAMEVLEASHPETIRVMDNLKITCFLRAVLKRQDHLLHKLWSTGNGMGVQEILPRYSQSFLSPFCSGAPSSGERVTCSTTIDGGEKRVRGEPYPHEPGYEVAGYHLVSGRKV